MPAEDLPDLRISEEKEQEIAHWLRKKHTAIKRGRAHLEELWEEIKDLYDKTELEEKKDYPFEGAAHLMIPLMPTFTEEIKAKLLNTIFAPRDPFSTTLTRKDFAPFLGSLKQFMTWAAEEELKLEEVLDPFFTEYLKLGDAILKIIYTDEVERAYEYDEVLEEWLEFPRTVKQQVEWVHVPLEDILWPLDSHSFEEADPKFHRVRKEWHELKAGEAQGRYKDVERIKDWVLHEETEADRERRDRQEVEVYRVRQYEIHEIWFSRAIKSDGVPDKMVWTVHLPSLTVLRKQYNWFPRGYDPFEKLGFEPREHETYSNGVGKMVLPYQKEVSTMHNQRLDSATLANVTVFKRRSDSMLPEQISIRSGATIPVDDIEDLEPMPLGRQFDSTLQEEEHTIQLLQQRLGMQDYLGPDLLAQGQSTAVLAALAEGRSRFDMILKRTRRFLKRAMTKSLLLYQKYYPEGKAAMVQGEDGQFTEVVWQFPEEWIDKGIGVTVTATSAASSKDTQRQNKLSLFGLVTQYYGQLTQYILQAQNPQLPEPMRGVLLQVVDGLSTLVEDILDDFELHNAEELALQLDAITQQARQAGLQVGPGGPQGQPGLAGPQGANGAPGSQGGGGSLQQQGTPGGT